MATITARAQAPARLIVYDRPPRGAGDRPRPEGLAMEHPVSAEILRRGRAMTAMRDVPDSGGAITA
ncbi:MAG: hypothetical protein GVY06_11260 [Alphaproteobacteria bacterium]|jgi:hypothetical protein|nr:hypothetical protein [Alphaproteobacteria bacterium]